MIERLSHITFIVGDIERMTKFLKAIFDAEEIYSIGEKTFSISREKFFLISDIWIAIMEGEPLSQKSYNHVAFKISEQDFEHYKKRINH